AEAPELRDHRLLLGVGVVAGRKRGRVYCRVGLFHGRWREVDSRDRPLLIAPRGDPLGLGMLLLQSVRFGESLITVHALIVQRHGEARAARQVTSTPWA